MNTNQAFPQKDRPEIWAVGGGKGGVGKSIVSILIAFSLARSGQKTVLVDADLGGANLHTLMGIKTPVRTLNDFVTRKYSTINDICVRTEVRHLQLVCGASEILSLANPQYAQKTKIVQSLMNLDAEHVVLDLGAGTSFNVLDFFLVADNPLVVLTPQPVSIQNAYAFVRNTIYRKLSRMASQQPSLQALIKTAMDPKNEQKMRTIGELWDAVQQANGQNSAKAMQDAVDDIKPMLITNMARDDRDRNAGRIIQLVAEKYLTIKAQDLGGIDYDPQIEAMVSGMQPLTRLEQASIAFDGASQLVRQVASPAMKSAS